MHADPSGYSYATLPDGTRMSMNSLADVTVFNKRRAEQLSTLASRDVAWIVPAEVVAHNDKMIEELQPLLQVLTRKFLVNANDAGYALFITWGKRTPEQIEAVGAASNGQHLYGNAIDVQFWDPIYEGVWPCDPVWFHWNIADYGIYSEYDSRWTQIAPIGKGVGLDWGGEIFGDYYDPVHFQIN